MELRHERQLKVLLRSRLAVSSYLREGNRVHILVLGNHRGQSGQGEEGAWQHRLLTVGIEDSDVGEANWQGGGDHGQGRIGLSATQRRRHAAEEHLAAGLETAPEDLDRSFLLHRQRKTARAAEKSGGDDAVFSLL